MPCRRTKTLQFVPADANLVDCEMSLPRPLTAHTLPRKWHGCMELLQMKTFKNPNLTPKQSALLVESVLRVTEVMKEEVCMDMQVMVSQRGTSTGHLLIGELC